ncbi:hypothetical protein TSAR_006962 [Trichomalopsis sarcophagae]|uniref:FAM21/CAPZIP domain-containing protein n=1 Tax=Trichomalopsis sarcophagae TaxID=543379 RepID=A0A232FCS8_9HYME|nr:hypothetical protein TSAR_006962 [Trichomalopsis sarcophagae]
MSSTRLKSEEIYNRERVPSDSLFVGRSSDNSTNESADQQQQQREQPSSLLEDVSEHEDVFGPPPLPKSYDAPRQKSKVASLFDDSDSGDDLFGSASPGSRSLRSSERTPSKTTTTSQNQPQTKSKGLFDDDDDLFGPKDAPDVDLFGSAPAKSSSKAGEGLFDDLADGGLFEKPKEKSKLQVSSLFGEAEDPLFGESSKKSSEKESKGLFKEPEKKKPAVSSKGLFEDPKDGDLFANVAKPAAVAEKSSSSSFKNIFEDTSDSDLFGSSSKNILDKNIVVDQSSDSLFSDSKEPSDLFDTKDTEASEEKSRKKEPSLKGLLEEKPKEQAKPNKLTTSIFDDSDDDEDLFGSVSKKSTGSNYSSLFGSDKNINIAKKMEEEKKVKTEKAPEKKLEEPPPVSAKPKALEKSSIFDDDDDDDDLFGEKKRKKEPSKSNKSAKDEVKKNTESKTKTEGEPDIASKKAIFTEIKQKLEKHKLEQTGGRPVKSDSSVVDGGVISKKEPPKTLKIQMPMTEESPASSTQQPSKKPLVSGKIKNLMGKMGDLKILSPTDTPPFFRKSNEEKSSGSNEDEQEVAGDLASSEASTPSLLSGGSSPHTSGTNSRARDSPSLKSDNTEVAISFDEPAQVETLASTASKSRARISAKRRPQSRQARQSALRHSGIDFDIVDASSTSATIDQSNGDVHLDVDRLLPSSRTEASERSSRQESGAHTDDKSEISASRNTTGNLLSPSTDEEDLFDVPPDLPEDPAAKEESLFGRAPILSPIETVEKPTSRRKAETTNKESEPANKTKESHKEQENKEVKEESTSCAPLDPLRDNSHDPLKDPSSLFAFVTKTPSPEKNQGLLLNEDDDSLFSSSSKSTDKPSEKKSKPGLDLFIDDDDDDTSSNDLFSSSKAKIKKPLKDTKIDLFDDVAAEDDDDSLFGSATKKSELQKIKESPAALSTVSSAGPKVEEKNESKSKEDAKKQSKIKTVTKDIFDNSSDDDDIFAGSKKTIPKKKPKSLFDDEEDDADDDNIFGKPKSSSTKDSKAALNKDRPVIKKAVTRDLKKTAEKIVEDPLSMLQED